MNHPGIKIKSIREQFGISRYALAKRSGVSISFINDLERGIKEPTVSTLSKLCAAIPISLSDFFSDETTDLPLDIKQLINIVKTLTPEQRQSLNVFLEQMKN